MEDAAPPAAAGPQLQQPASACSLDQPRSETNDTLSLLAKSFSLCPDAFGLTRLADGLIVAVNDGFSRVTGYTQAEVVGRPAARLGIWANPQDRERLIQFLFVTLARAQADPPATMELPLMPSVSRELAA